MRQRCAGSHSPSFQRIRRTTGVLAWAVKAAYTSLVVLSPTTRILSRHTQEKGHAWRSGAIGSKGWRTCGLSSSERPRPCRAGGSPSAQKQMGPSDPGRGLQSDFACRHWSPAARKRRRAGARSIRLAGHACRQAVDSSPPRQRSTFQPRSARAWRCLRLLYGSLRCQTNARLPSATASR